MNISVPLVLNVVDAVICRLDTTGTRALDPPGAATSGYDDAFREPVASDTTQGASVADRAVARVELAPVRVPCQVETAYFNKLAEAFQGNLQQDELGLVFLVKDLKLLNLLDATTGKPKFGIGDRVSALEKHNIPNVNAIQMSQEGLFFREIFPASWGFGDSYNLWIGIITSRDKANL